MGKYIRKTTRQSWSEESIQRAILAVRHGAMGLKRACKQFNVSRSTLQRRCRKEGSSEIAAEKGLGSRHPCFSPELEKEMVNHLKKMEALLFGLTPKQLREMAFQFAEINHIPHSFNKEKMAAGYD